MQYYHRTFVELAYEMPGEVPFSEEDGDVELFLEQFRSVIITAMGMLPTHSPRDEPMSVADRAFQETETVWLMSILGTSTNCTSGVGLGARLQILVQGMACNILSEDRHSSPSGLRGQIRARPYSYMCSGEANRLHKLGKLRQRII